MTGLGIRKTLRRNAWTVLDRLEGMLADEPAAPADVWDPRQVDDAPVSDRPPGEPVGARAAAPVEPKAQPQAQPEAQPEAKTEAPPNDEAPFTADELEVVLDEMVRPALHMDGGDMALVKIEGHNVYVRLVGACSTCPSSVITMKQGIQRLLEEEFPTWRGELIQVNDLI